MLWTLVTEKLPSDDSNLMVSVDMGDGMYGVIDKVKYLDGKWYKHISGAHSRTCELNKLYGEVKVLAWMPYPRPYIPQGE